MLRDSFQFSSSLIHRTDITPENERPSQEGLPTRKTTRALVIVTLFNMN